MSSDTSKPKSRPRRCIRALILLVVLLVAAGGGYTLFVLCVMDNFHTVVPGQVHCSGQPSEKTLRKWISRYGLKTVINLRGRSSLPFYRMEHEMLAGSGVTIIDIRFSADRMPTALWFRRFIEALATADRPMLLHCRDGIDRSGLASVIAAMAVGGQDYDTALDQLSVWRFQWSFSRHGIFELLTEYESYCHREGLGTGGWRQFSNWALTRYHRHYYQVDISAPDTLTAEPSERVGIPVTITNRSLRTIPVTHADKKFQIATFWGERKTVWPLVEAWAKPNTDLLRRDIAPGSSVDVVHYIRAPAKPGRYVFHIDLCEADKTFFGTEGSYVKVCELVVGGDTTLREVALRRP